MTESWRCFVAIPVGPELRAALATSVAGWRRMPDLAGLRWSEPEAWHLTLAFLGDIPATDVPRLSAALDAGAGGHEVGELRTSGLGAFPSASRARVAWCGVADPSGRLTELAEAVREGLALPAGEPFRAHVTLARARSAPVELRRWVASPAPDVRVPVDRMQLMRSHLGQGPARYEVLASVPLGVPAGV